MASESLPDVLEQRHELEHAFRQVLRDACCVEQVSEVDVGTDRVVAKHGYKNGYSLDQSEKTDLQVFEKNGAPCRIRTCDLPVRSRTLYPAELRALDKPPIIPSGRIT